MAYQSIINLSFLIGAIAFVWGLRLLSSPDTARRGNILAGIGMGIAIIASIIMPAEMIRPAAVAANNYGWIAGGMVVGTAVGFASAKRIQMTAMPQLVSVFNGLGGACAVVLAMAELLPLYNGNPDMDLGQLVIILLALLIGGVSFTGSMLAFAKLQGLVWDNQVTLPKHNVINMVLLVATLAVGVWLAIQGSAAG
ncbi:MAG: NAD(P)(+) transhydrogenase (Re/Si-specific) subunit beta, partial [Bacteroidota bacterium]